jgi:putative addiction module component (TIGR02574 family)
MTKQALLDEINRLPVEERIELLGEAWDRLAADSDSVPVPEWHLRELERRLAEPNPSYVSWEELRARLGHGGRD